MSLDMTLTNREILALGLILLALEDGQTILPGSLASHVRLVRDRFDAAIEYKAQSQIFEARQIRKERSVIHEPDHRPD